VEVIIPAFPPRGPRGGFNTERGKTSAILVLNSYFALCCINRMHLEMKGFGKFYLDISCRTAANMLSITPSIVCIHAVKPTFRDLPYMLYN